MPATKFEFGRTPLTVIQVGQIASNALPVSVPADVSTHLEASVQLLAKMIADGLDVYGVTTGFGDSCEASVDETERLALAKNLIRFHGCGVGPAFSVEESRAIVAARIATLVRGYSAVRPAVVQRLIDFLNHDIAPVIPVQGSVGASGDLTPLSYVAATIAGEREVLLRGQRMSSAVAMKEVGIAPVELLAKESLAIMNGTSVMSGVAALCLLRAERLGRLACTLTAAASDVTSGRPEHFADRIFELKPHPGQRQAATWIRQSLNQDREGSHRIQDRYSIRCAPHVIGVLFDELPHSFETIETELNGINDNPIFDPESGRLYHGGNFYGGHVCQIMDTIKTCVANVADLLDRQLLLCCHPGTNNGLPANLVGAQNSAAHHGFKAMQITTSALVAEACKLTMPASVFSRSTENHNQDKVSMGTIAARDCTSILTLAEQVAAIHTLAMVQAAELRGLDACGPGLIELHRTIRSHSPFNDADRAMDGDIGWVMSLIKDGTLAKIGPL